MTRRLVLVVAIVLSLAGVTVTAATPAAPAAAQSTNLNDCQYRTVHPQCPEIHVVLSSSLNYRSGVRMNQWFNLVWENCWMLGKIGNLSGKAFVQTDYAAGPCTDNTGEFMFVQLRGANANVRYYNPNNDGTTYNRCTYWVSRPGCSVIQSDNSLFYGDPWPQATDIVFGYFLLCKHDGLDEADRCNIVEVSPF